MSWLLVTVPAAPLAAALLTVLAGRRWARWGGWLAVAGTAVSLVCLLVLGGSPQQISVPWFTLGELELSVGLQLDRLSWPMAVLVSSVCALVNLYSIGYEQEDSHRPRFFSWMSFFAGAMLTLVLAGSFVLWFAAWEAVGLVSWALIGFHHREQAARRAALKAFLLTRIGDFGFLLAWLLVLVITGTTAIDRFLEHVQSGTFSPTTLTLIALLFFVAAVSKSAQLPLSAWLPDAMAGPAPVSALIHSATMVAAGVYLLLRLYPLYEASGIARGVILWTGAATALLAALIATAQSDLKRIFAWSTVSHLGEMMLALGLAGPIAAAFHLTTHAAFKSTLFLAAGAVEQTTGKRELSQLGGVLRKMPWTAGALVLASLAAAGLPPLSGYWSEEAILKAALAAGVGWGVLLLIVIALAGIYLGRAAAALLVRSPNAPGASASRTAWTMLVPLGVLAVAAAAVGYPLKTPLEKWLPFSAGGHVEPDHFPPSGSRPDHPAAPPAPHGGDTVDGVGRRAADIDRIACPLRRLRSYRSFAAVAHQLAVDSDHRRFL